MSIKPAAVSSVLPPVLREPGNKPPDNNRFAVLMNRGRSPSVGGPLTPVPAVKRPSTGGGGPAQKTTRLDNNRVFFVMETVEKMLTKGRDDFLKAKNALRKDKDLPPAAKEILGGIIAGFENISDAVETIASVVVDSAKAGPVPDGGGSLPKGGKASAPAKPVDPAKVKKDKFCGVVREAEKSLLVFQLDLGKVPIMNQATMARSVTQDIVRKAAAAEGSTNGRPAEETILALDDTLSVVEGMDFFGKVTKPYQNRKNDKDPANGTFHTLPVKINFKTKEAKQRAELIFRKKCKLQCGTPYPKRLRTMIGELVSAEKTQHPGCFIQVKVDLESMALKVSRRTDSGWLNNYSSVAISDKVLDTNTVGNVEVMDCEVRSQASL
jgi:hypothetical protein